MVIHGMNKKPDILPSTLPKKFPRVLYMCRSSTDLGVLSHRGLATFQNKNPLT